MSGPGQPLIVPAKGELVIGQDKQMYVQTESGFIKKENGSLFLVQQGKSVCLEKGEKLLVSEAGEILRHVENGSLVGKEGDEVLKKVSGEPFKLDKSIMLTANLRGLRTVSEVDERTINYGS